MNLHHRYEVTSPKSFKKWTVWENNSAQRNSNYHQKHTILPQLDQISSVQVLQKHASGIAFSIKLNSYHILHFYFKMKKRRHMFLLFLLHHLLSLFPNHCVTIHYHPPCHSPGLPHLKDFLSMHGYTILECFFLLCFCTICIISDIKWFLIYISSFIENNLSIYMWISVSVAFPLLWYQIYVIYLYLQKWFWVQ